MRSYEVKPLPISLTSVAGVWDFFNAKAHPLCLFLSFFPLYPYSSRNLCSYFIQLTHYFLKNYCFRKNILKTRRDLKKKGEIKIVDVGKSGVKWG